MTDVDYSNYHRDFSYERSESLFRNIFKKRFDIIYRFVKKGKALDIGSSTGILLQIFKNNGFEVLGIEPSNSSGISKKRGVKVINDYFENVNLPKNNFDLVIMNHTLEHVKDANLVLKKIYSILKKEGILFVDVPNAGSFSSKILKEKWPYRLPEEHTYQFTKNSLGKFLKTNHFQIVHWESRSGIFEYANPMKELLDSLLNLKKRFVTDIITFPYAVFATLTKQGDSMSFVAKKV